MSKKRVLLLTMALVIIAAVAVIIVKAQHKHVFRRVNPAFREYISAFTTGIISTESAIRVRLAVDYADTSLFNKEAAEKYFSFSPSIKGKLYWVDNRTLEFRPEKKLPQNMFYEAEFYLYKLLQVPDSLRTMEFQFKTTQQDFEVIVDNHKAYDGCKPQREKILGHIRTADVAELTDVSKILNAEQNGKELPIKWSQDAGKKIYYFTVDSVNRESSAGSVELKWDGDAIGADRKGKIPVVIPALSTFIVNNVVANLQPDQYVTVQFSESLDEEQNLEGLISLGGRQGLRFSVEDNELKIYPDIEMTGTQILSIEASIKNSTGKTLDNKYVKEIIFENNKPSVRLTENGVIIPSSKGILFPFEAINLNAIDVKIIRIYENNVTQFLQVNNLDGKSELARVGRTILKKTIPLTSLVDYNKWNRFSFDLTDLIKPEPGAIYSIKISFKKAYSTYPCTGGDDNVAEEDNSFGFNNVNEEDEDGKWYYYSDSYYDNDYDDYYYYDWEHHEDPCSRSYYNNKSITRNVLASNLGLLAKREANGTMNVFVTDLLNAKPVSDATVELYDFQQQQLATAKTNNDGMATMTVKRLPFLMIAKKAEQRGYLKLIDGDALSLSMFDVSGEVVQKGLKGCIYGERGVWRPGDSLYLTFVLEDKNKLLPVNHPVIFEFTNPKGQLYKRMIKTTSVNGFYDFRTATDVSSPTGNWMAKVKVGGAEFTKNIKIETVKPNHLKINLNFGTPFLYKNSTAKAVLESRWLHGAIAKKLEADVSLTLTRSSTSFKKFPAYEFDDPSRKFSTENISMFKGKLDDNGRVEFVPQINITSAAPGVLKAFFETRVFEGTGDFSIDRFSMDYYPFESYAGLLVPAGGGYNDMIYTDRDYQYDVANVDMNGTLVSSNTLKVEIYKLEWRWWWDNTSDNVADFISGQYAHLYKTFDLATVGGKSKFKFNVPHDEWGRYFIRVIDQKSGHSCGSTIYADWYGYIRTNNEGQQSATMLSFTADKEKYKVGDKVKLSIPSPAKGSALISIETGSRILQSLWTETKQGNTEVSFKVTEEMAPNIYVYVTLLQPHAQTINDLPIRLYGVIPVLVEDPNTHLRPLIKAPVKWVPEKNASLTVSEENGKAMTYTLAIVDEGLLDLTRFKTPDLWSVFYAREALGIKTWDMFDLVMGAFSGELQRILSIGGDGEGSGKGAQKANRFKPMVKFIGPIELKKGQSKTHTFKMPQYIGSVRVMVVAGNNGAYGSAEKAVQVKKPLMIQGTLPRVIGSGETVKLPVSVFAMENQVKEVSVQISVNNMFTINGAAVKKLKFNKPGDEIVQFELKAKESIGVAKVKITAQSGSETSVQDIEIDVRNPNPRITKTIEYVLEPGKSWNASFLPVGIPGTNKGVLELSSVPPINLQKRLSYLIAYPYGCIEQTTSSVFPQLYLTEVSDLTETQRTRIENNIRSGVNRLRQFQVPNGGLSYWPGDSYTDDWGTCYAGHFMLEAEQKGYTLPVGFLLNWKRYQKQRALSWAQNNTMYNNDLIQAYRLYTLALAKSPELGAMNRLLEQKNLSLTAKWRLAAAYVLAGKPETAQKLIYNLSYEIKPYRELYYTYGSDYRDKAMIIETLCLLNQKSKAMPLVKQLSADLSKEYWMSTQTTAYSLIAICKFIEKAGDSRQVKYEFTLDSGQPVQVSSVKAISQNDLNIKFSGKKNQLKLKNTGKGILYARIILDGVPAKGQEVSAENNLKMMVSYHNVLGQSIDPADLPQGTDFYAEVTVINPGMRGYYNQMALSMIFPSGWEIRNERMSDAPATTPSSQYTYQDIRNDRVYTFFDLAQNQRKTFTVMLNASYIGKYYLPAVYCEAMYDNSINASLAGKWVEVKE